jgi:hypothetical protein
MELEFRPGELNVVSCALSEDLGSILKKYSDAKR